MEQLPPPRLKRFRAGTVNRSLELMELVREERALLQPPNWGKKLYDRMAETEGQPERLKVSPIVQQITAQVPPSQTLLDLREYINELSEDEIWSALRSCSHTNQVDVSGWLSISEKPLRSIAIVLGDHLEMLDVSNTPITDAMLQIVTSRLYCLKSVRMSGCQLAGSGGVRDIVGSCSKTLTHLDFSNSQRIDDDAMGWVAGVLGYQRPACKKLVTLNLSDCTAIHDEGLFHLSQSCHKLQYLNLTRCTGFTDKGVCAITKANKRLKVCSLHAIPGVGDASLRSIGKYCSELVSLNVSRCGEFTDSGVRALARGCTKLQALNLAGAIKVSERGLYEIATNCPGIQTLNVTGCQEITLNGLRAAIEGLKYVTEAKSYFGFFPTKDAVERKLNDQQKMIEVEAASRIQTQWSNLMMRGHARAVVSRKRRERAAVTIQRAYMQYLRRLREWHREKERSENAAAMMLQRVWRGRKDREAYARRLEYKHWFQAQSSKVTRIQAAWRGFWVRLKDKDVNRMLISLYEKRRHEAMIAAAVFTQANVRRFIACLRVSAWRELWHQRKADRHLAALRIQCCTRQYIALRLMLTMQAEKDRITALRNKAAARIQSAYRGLQGKYNALMTRAEIERLNRLRNRRALDVQRAFRGFLGREVAEMAKIQRSRENRAATKIQSMWRCSRVLHWQAIKLNKVAAFVFRREEMELEEAAVGAQQKEKAWVTKATHDSASESETEDMEEVWQELWDDNTQQPYWYSSKSNEIRYEEPESTFAFELELIGLNVKIFWELEDQWFEGAITRFNKTKRRHRVEYPDGDHEWINLADQSERVQIVTENGVTMFSNYSTPSLERRKERAEAKRVKLNANKKREEENWAMVGIDPDTSKMRWINNTNGEMRMQADDYNDWIMFTDLDGCMAFKHVATGEVLTCLDRDPRFDKSEDSEEMVLQKQHIQEDLSMGVYLCSSLIEEYYSLPEEPAIKRRKVMQKILTQPGYLKLKAGIRHARQAYTEQEFAEDPLCSAGESILKQYIALFDWGKQEEMALAEKKKSLLKTDRYTKKATYRCPACHKQIGGNESYCPICGEAIPVGLLPSDE